MLLSDGVHYVTGMLQPQLNAHVSDGSLRKLSVLRVKEYFPRKVVSILAIDVLGNEATDVIGAPTWQPGQTW